MNLTHIFLFIFIMILIKIIYENKEYDRVILFPEIARIIKRNLIL